MPQPEDAKLEQVEQARRIVEEFFSRQRSGDDSHRESLYERHPELKSELQSAFTSWDRVTQARLAALSMGRSADSASRPTQEDFIRIRCPHCGASLQAAGDASWSNLACQACGETFDFFDEPLESPSQLGQFQLLQRVGVGAHGTVWKAHDQDLDRFVALKVPRNQQDISALGERFAREARSAAQLAHPYIVRLLEIGRENGTYYIASEFIDGTTLRSYVGGKTLSLGEKVELFRKIVVAIEHAHHRGVIHRDLKPGNIMVDDAGDPHVTDFGLAKRDASDGTLTMEGHILGTPGFMAPEQAAGQGHLSDARTDIYALGVILFQMLTERLPFNGTVATILHQVQSLPAPRLRSQIPSIPKSLDLICNKCLQTSPDDRYASCTDLLADVTRCLTDMRRSPSPRVVGRKTTVVVGGLIIIAATAAMCFLWANVLRQSETGRVSTADGPPQFSDTSDGNETTSSETIPNEKAEITPRDRYNSTLRAVNANWSSEPGLARQTLLKQEDCPIALRDFAWDWLHQRCVETMHRAFTHNNYVLQTALSTNGEFFATVDNSNVVRAWRVLDQQPIGVSIEPPMQVNGLAISSDGKHVAVGGTHSVLFVYDLANGEVARRTPATHFGTAMDLEFSDDGSLLCWRDVLREGDFLSTAISWRFMEEPDGHRNSLIGSVPTLTVPSPNGRQSLIAQRDIHRLAVVDHVSRETAATVEVNSNVTAACWSPDGKGVFFADVDGTVSTWKWEEESTAQVVATGVAELTHLAANIDRHRIIGMDKDNRVWGIDIVDGRVRQIVLPEVPTLYCVSLSRDGRRLVRVSYKTAFVTDIGTQDSPTTIAMGGTTGPFAVDFRDESIIYRNGAKVERVGMDPPASEPKVLLDLAADATDIAVTTDGRLIGSCHRDGVFRLYDGEDGAELLMQRVVPADTACWGIFFCDDPLRVVVLTYALQMSVFEIGMDQQGHITLGEPRVIPVARHTTGHVESGDRRQLLLSRNGEVVLWDTATMAPLRELGPSYERSSTDQRVNVYTPLAATPDFALAAWYCEPDGITIWDLPQDRRLAHVMPTSTVSCLALSPDGSTLAVGADSGTIELLDPVTGQLRATLFDGSKRIHRLVFDRSGEKLIASCGDHTIRIWQRGPFANQPRRYFVGHGSIIDDMTVCEGERKLASVADDGTVRFWSLPDGSPAGVLRFADIDPAQVSYNSMDGSLAIGAVNHCVYRHRVADLTRLNVLGGNTFYITCLATSRDGRWLASGDGKGAMALWHNGWQEPAVKFWAHAPQVYRAVFSPDAQTLYTCNNTGEVLGWNTTSGERTVELLRLENENTLAIDCSPSGDMIAIGGTAEEIAIIASDGTRQPGLSVPGSDAVLRLLFLGSEHRLASTHWSGTVRIWDLRHRRLLAELFGHGENVAALAYDEVDRMLYSGDKDGRIAQWDVDRFAHGATEPRR